MQCMNLLNQRCMIVPLLFYYLFVNLKIDIYRHIRISFLSIFVVTRVTSPAHTIATVITPAPF